MKPSQLLYGLILAFSASANAATPTEAITASLSAKLNTQVTSVKPTPIKELFEVTTSKGIIYASKDGKYILQGNLYSLSNGVDNLTEKSMAKLRVSDLKAQEKHMIVYPAPNEKYVVNVFTDVDCGYCRKLHQDLAGYNELGITIRYLAFPRGGKRSKAFGTMEQIWCADDPAKAMTDAKNGKSIQAKTCANPVMEQFQLGQTFGVRGTPALVLNDGTMIPGYMPPAKLLAELQKH